MNLVNTLLTVDMAKEDRIAVRLDAPAKAALEKAAIKDGRSISGMAAKIITNWLKRHAE